MGSFMADILVRLAEIDLPITVQLVKALDLLEPGLAEKSVRDLMEFLDFPFAFAAPRPSVADRNPEFPKGQF